MSETSQPGEAAALLTALRDKMRDRANYDFNFTQRAKDLALEWADELDAALTARSVPSPPKVEPDVHLLAWAVSNCYMLARRRIAKQTTDEEWWQHVLRICEKAGATSQGVLRAAVPREITEGSRAALPVLGDIPHEREHRSTHSEALPPRDETVGCRNVARIEDGSAGTRRAECSYDRNSTIEIAEEKARDIAVENMPDGRAVRPPQVIPSDSADFVLSHWFVQGGEAQFGPLRFDGHEPQNADEFISALLTKLRKEIALPGAGALEHVRVDIAAMIITMAQAQFARDIRGSLAAASMGATR